MALSSGHASDVLLSLTFAVEEVLIQRRIVPRIPAKTEVNRILSLA